MNNTKLDLQKFQELIVSIVGEAVDLTEQCLLKGDQVNIDQETLGLSSLEIVELVISIEADFHITITEDEVQQLKTVGDMIRLVNEEIEVQLARDFKKEEVKKMLFGDENEVVKI